MKTHHKFLRPISFCRYPQPLTGAQQAKNCLSEIDNLGASFCLKFES